MGLGMLDDDECIRVVGSLMREIAPMDVVSVEAAANSGECNPRAASSAGENVLYQYVIDDFQPLPSTWIATLHSVKSLLSLTASRRIWCILRLTPSFIGFCTRFKLLRRRHVT